MVIRERTLRSLFVLSGLSAVVSSGEFHRPAALVENPSPLKQRILKPTSDVSDGLDLGPSTLGRLLIRQNTCMAGTSTCSEAGRCCPTGGDCCPNSGCCGSGNFCYGNGCCATGEAGCAQNSCCPAGATCCPGGGCCSGTDSCVTVNGQRGCCPNGQTCSGSPMSCSITGYTPCPSDNYCCPSGDTCVRDSNNQPSCSGGGSTQPAGSGSGSMTPVSTPSNTASVPKATYTLQPPPVSQAGSTNSTVAATDGRIVYSPQWTTSSTCSAVTRSCNDTGAYMKFQFIGTAVYMNLQLGTSGVVYTADVDGQADTVDGYRTTDSCGTGWSRFDLASGLHTVTVTIAGPSPNSPSGNSQAGMDFTSFVYVLPCLFEIFINEFMAILFCEIDSRRKLLRGLRLQAHLRVLLCQVKPPGQLR
ncbi:hypothetical protein BD410DRAFT_129642 [Rickenella mellea]|uniref:Granulins domain-containing protein n=1 Tax=Rickenella mellea TaxID=50990 RepID=A0A4Y7Q8L9_9AGAM|nr:hypothetical protein BD410DRAFT_129642 [Rickenella mellea]